MLTNGSAPGFGGLPRVSASRRAGLAGACAARRDGARGAGGRGPGAAVRDDEEARAGSSGEPARASGAGGGSAAYRAVEERRISASSVMWAACER